MKTGWTAERRRVYFSRFNRARREYKGGNSFAGYVARIRHDALESLHDAERAELASILEERTATPPPPAPPRASVKEWTMADLEPALVEAGRERSLARGKEAFAAAQCLACHRLGRDGGSVGPELTGVSGRFNRRDLLENILLPSKVISDRYQSFTITRRDGEEISGRITEETDEKVVVLVNPLTQQHEQVLKKDIQSREVSKLSQMPEGLLNTLTKGEILDLLAYVETDGRTEEAAFGRGNQTDEKDARRNSR